MTDLTTLETEGTRFDAALESAGGTTPNRVRHITHRTGRLIWFGQAGGQPTRLGFFDWVDGDVGTPIEQFH